VNYAYDDKYLLTATLRRDGSSNFGADNRYGTFPSVSAGWRLSREKFMEGFNALQDLKIRASWGQTGNQAIGAFGYVSTMSAANAIFGSTVVTGFAPSNLANTGLKWEANEQTDIGLDFSLLRGRIQVVADYFVKKSKDLLIGIPIPSFSGFQSQTVNLGTIENKGWELGINAAILEGEFKWNFGFNISSIKNEVLDLGTNAAGGQNEFFGYAPFTTNGPVNITRVGQPIGAFYGLQTNGIFRSIQETQGYPVQPGIVALPGDYKYVDQNKDGVINDLDRVILGSPFPDFFGGITNDFSYKNFTLNVFSNFVSGIQVFNHTRLMLEDFGDASGGTAQLDRFTSFNTAGQYPRMTLGNAAGYNRLNSDRWIDDASFLRIRNITLGYNVPAKALKNLKLDGLRLYTSVNNAFTFTSYKGWDPEVNSSGSNVLSNGIDQGGYPVARSFIFGVNLKF
jgi:TonB-linked SusC/RagA family outer membrane protein